MSIAIFPQTILLQPTKEIKFGSLPLENIISSMSQAMQQERGIGLAANQIGLPYRIFIMKLEDSEPLSIFINPVIIHKSDEKTIYTEGCLSFPGIRIEKERNSLIKLHWQNLTGETQTGYFDGLASICIQHEIDHLDGKTFIDDLSPLKKQMIVKKIQKFVSKKR